MSTLSSETTSPKPTGENPAPLTRTLWHRILGTLLELLLTRLGILVQSEVQVMSDPPKVDILLLRREGERWTDEQLPLLCDGLRDTLANHLLIEFKYTESLSADALLQALGYQYFYRQAQRLNEAELQVFVMVAQTPRKRVLNQYRYETSAIAGVYQSKQPLLDRVQVIVLNQLQFTPHNAFVQCFASQRRVYRSAFERIQEFGQEQLSDTLWELVAGLHKQRDRKESVMTKVKQEEVLTAEKLMQIGRETRKFVLATLPLEQRLAGLTAEERVAGLAPAERVAGLAPEERVAGLALKERLVGLVPKERLAKLAPEESAKLMEQIEQFLNQHEGSGQ